MNNNQWTQIQKRNPVALEAALWRFAGEKKRNKWKIGQIHTM